MIFTALPRPAGFLQPAQGLAAHGVRYWAEEGAYLGSGREVELGGEGCCLDGMNVAALRFIDSTAFLDKVFWKCCCGKLSAWCARLEKQGSAHCFSLGCKRTPGLVPVLCSGPIWNVPWWHLPELRVLGSAGDLCWAGARQDRPLRNTTRALLNRGVWWWCDYSTAGEVWLVNVFG